jgi:GntR family transcriptional repressor for pyruvate dehydrogenase complex
MPERSARRRSDGVRPSAPAPRGKASDEIIDGIMRDIVDGVLRRGDRLPNERELAQHFGVSQPTVREAVRVLDAMGLVDVRHGSGVYVNGDTQQFLARSLLMLLQIESVRILDVVAVRGVLGRVSARRAAEHATPEDIARIAEYADQLVRLGDELDVQGIADAVVGFQLAVSAAAHNPLLYALEAFLVRLSMQFQLAARTDESLRSWRERAMSLNPDRQRLLHAVREGDGDAARAAWDTYLNSQYELFANDRQLSGIRLSDPKHAATLSWGSLESLS